MSSNAGPAILKFVRKAGGTGSTLSTTYLGYDGDAVTNNECPAVFRAVPDAVMDAVEVETFYFGVTPANGADPFVKTLRAAAAAYLKTFREAVIYRPVLVKQFARGCAVAARLTESWGDLVLEKNTGGAEVVLLADCTLIECGITDDVASYGLGLKFKFGRVAGVLAPV